jgi:hypothetical protein
MGGKYYDRSSESKIGEYVLDPAGSGYGQVADTCESGHEPSGYIKCGEFLDYLKTG